MTKKQFQEMSEYLDTNPIPEKEDGHLLTSQPQQPKPPTKRPLATLGDFFPSVVPTNK